MHNSTSVGSRAPPNLTERMGAYLFLGSWAITVLSTMAGLLLLFWSLFYVIEPLSNSTQWLFIAIPFIIPIASLSGAALSAYYVLLAATIFLSIAYVAKRDVVPGMRKIRATMETQRERGLWDSNMMVLGPRLLSLMFFFPTISYILVGGMGASPEVPSFGEYPAWLRFYGFANASVWEEIIIRIFFIGIPLSYAYHVRSGGQRGVGRKIILRGLGKMTPLAFWLLLFSSFMFAMAHAFGGWDFYKVPPTFFTGLCLGYAFIMKGLPAAIVLHFALDFFTMPAFMVPALWPVVELAFIILVLAGAYNTIKYGVAIFSKNSMPGIKSASTRRL